MKPRAAAHVPRAHSRTVPLRRRLLPLLIAGCFAPAAALANPGGQQVVRGDVTFSQQGGVLTVTNSPGAIINWQNFSIDPGEVTRFVQQSASSSVLNRVVGQDPSKILGTLQSNGRVFLVNPNGILFGQGARVDVNGLVASTLNISDDDFLAGRMKFAGSDAGKLENAGEIRTAAGGQVYLIAPDVENSGIINAPNGDVLLAAGHTVHLADSTNPALQVVLSAPEDEALNVGQIVAAGGTASVYGALIRQRGRVSADSAVVGENGRIVFKASRDTLLEAGSVTSATGAGKGGEIRILGERVGLTGDARVDASGRTGGGSVLVGGDFQGKNPDIENARFAYLGAEAEISADAGATGDGGRIIVWSDNTTRAFGTLHARGGTQGGDGGFVEVSGKDKLEYAAQTDLTAPHGNTGTLLLDPEWIEIYGSDCGGDCTPSGGFQGWEGYGGPLNDPGSVFYEDDGPSVIYESQIEEQSATADIILEATDGISVYGSFINDDVALAPDSNLIMRTRNGSGDSDEGGIDLIAGDGVSPLFSTQGTGTITLQAGTAPEGSDPWLRVGRLRSDAAINLSSRGGLYLEDSVQGESVTLQADDMTLSGTIEATGTGVWLKPSTPGKAIKVGGAPLVLSALDGDTDPDEPALELDVDELNRITADVLRIGSTDSGDLTIMSALYGGPEGALENVHQALSLYSGGTIGQLENAVITGSHAVQASGATVDLTAANDIGVIAGSAATGNFSYRSNNQISLEHIDGVSGVRLVGDGAGRWISLRSENYGISQLDGALVDTNGGGLAVRAVDEVGLWESGNRIRTLAGQVTGTSDRFGVVSGSEMSVGTVDDLVGIETVGADVELHTGADKTLSIDNAIDAGAGEVNLEADRISLNADVTADSVGISPITAGRAITVGSDTCDTSPCLAITGLSRLHAPTIGIGNEDMHPSGRIHVVGISAPGTGAATDRNALTTRIGLLSGGGVSQEGAIDVDELVVHVTGEDRDAVLEHAGNRVNTMAARMAGGKLSFVNAQDLTVGHIYKIADTSDQDDQGYDYQGISTQGGNVSLTAASGDVHATYGIDAGTGNVMLNAGQGEVDGLVSGDELKVSAAAGITLVSDVNSASAVNANTTGESSISIANAKSIELKEIRQQGQGGSVAIVTGSTEDDVADIRVSGEISAAGEDGFISLYAGGAIVDDGGKIKAATLSAIATRGISLDTEVASLDALNMDEETDSDIDIVNHGALHITSLHQSGGDGDIKLENHGATTVTGLSAYPQYVAVSTEGGSISLTANSPLTIDGTVQSESGAIHLVASPSTGGNDNLTINGTVQSNGQITLQAGGKVDIVGTVIGNYTVQQATGGTTADGAGEAIKTVTTTIDQTTNTVTQQNAAASSTPADENGGGSDEQEQAPEQGEQQAAADNETGASDNEPAKKMYCN